jgi:hypothetical protein
VLAYAAILAVISTIAWEAIEGRREGGESYTRAITVGLFTVTTVGLGLQYFTLRTGKMGGNLLAGFLIVTWVIPLVVGAIWLAITPSRPGGAPEPLPMAVMALSPVAGIAVSASFGELERLPDSVKMAALVPPISLTFLFQWLTMGLQRRIDRLILRAAETTKEGVDLGDADLRLN